MRRRECSQYLFVNTHYNSFNRAVYIKQFNGIPSEKASYTSPFIWLIRCVCRNDYENSMNLNMELKPVENSYANKFADDQILQCQNDITDLIYDRRYDHKHLHS